MKSLIESGAIYELIEKELNNLPGEKAHIEMIPYRTAESLANFDDRLSKKSAVLCLLTAKNQTLEITLMERTKDGSPHSRQISFPGGKMEETDNNLSHTALRETHEEIGIAPNKIKLIGQLTPFYIPVSNFQVTPFIGFGDNFGPLRLSRQEVVSVFNISIEDLLNPQFLTKKDIPNHLGQTLKNVPCFYINEKVIWGATSLILNEVKLILNAIAARHL